MVGQGRALRSRGFDGLLRNSLTLSGHNQVQILHFISGNHAQHSYYSRNPVGFSASGRGGLDAGVPPASPDFSNPQVKRAQAQGKTNNGWR